jgi:hypothetical protein
MARRIVKNAITGEPPYTLPADTKRAAKVLPLREALLVQSDAEAKMRSWTQCAVQRRQSVAREHGRPLVAVIVLYGEIVYGWFELQVLR